MTYPEALACLMALPRFTDQGAAAYRPGLARMEALMAGMGQPHRAYPSVHIAGTNGKGSTASLLAAISQATGRRTGLHTSPHLFRLNERMRLDGVPVPDAWLADAVARFRPLFDTVQPSFFEATTALSFLYFAEAGVDLAVVEVGLGGRLDATNLLLPRLTLITSIGLDHTDLLGETLADIAREKAGIIKPGTPVLTAVTAPEALAVLRETAHRHQAPWHRVQDEVAVTAFKEHLDAIRLAATTPLRSYPALEVGLPGHHQQANALLAVRAAEVLFEEVRHDPTALYEGLRTVRARSGLHGRLEVLQPQPLVVADVAHNPEGLATALAFVNRHRPTPAGVLQVLLGVMQDKDVAAMARLLAGADTVVRPVHLASGRALPAQALQAVLEANGVATQPPATLVEGWEVFQATATHRDVLLATGSHLVVAGLPGFHEFSAGSQTWS